MIITAVFDAVYCVELEVPDGTTEAEAEALAGEWLDENICEVSEGINESEIDVKEVYL